MTQTNITEPDILDLNGMYWEEDGKEVEFIGLFVFQIEPTINRLLAGAVDDFGSDRRDSLLERLSSHTHIIKNGSAYSYILLVGDHPFIILRQIPTEWDDEGNII